MLPVKRMSCEDMQMQWPRMRRIHFDIDIPYALSSVITDIDRSLMPAID